MGDLMGGEGAAPFSGPSREAPAPFEYLGVSVRNAESSPSSFAIVLLRRMLFIRRIAFRRPGVFGGRLRGHDLSGRRRMPGLRGLGFCLSRTSRGKGVQDCDGWTLPSSIFVRHNGAQGAENADEFSFRPLY